VGSSPTRGTKATVAELVDAADLKSALLPKPEADGYVGSNPTRRMISFPSFQNEDWHGERTQSA
jgi:hypothetical protein